MRSSETFNSIVDHQEHDIDKRLESIVQDFQFYSRSSATTP